MPFPSPSLSPCPVCSRAMPPLGTYCAQCHLDISHIFYTVQRLNETTAPRVIPSHDGTFHMLPPRPPNNGLANPGALERAATWQAAIPLLTAPERALIHAFTYYVVLANFP